MDLDALLQEREDAPSGEDLEYDPEFTDLEIAAMPGEERQVGDEIIHAEDPDYKEVAAKALAILERSHDLRAGVYIAEAHLRMKGLPGFAAATSYLRGCLEQYWASCHPQLDEDDDDDPTMRVNAILALTDDSRILRGLRRAPLTESRTFGMMSMRHIAVADGEITPPSDMDSVPDKAGIAAAFQDTDDEKLQEISAAASQALEDVKAISAKFDEETPAMGPDLDPLVKLLGQINAQMSDALGEPVSDAAGDAMDEGAAGGGGGAQPAAAGGSGAINSPNDVLNTLDRIIAYYERSEPSSPLPVLLHRAKTLVNADFVTIIKELAPAGIENVNLVGGISEEEDY